MARGGRQRSFAIRSGVNSPGRLLFSYFGTAGGGHVSEGHDQLEKTTSVAFANLVRSDAGGWVVSAGNGMLRPEYGGQFATVRQIGWELEQTIKRHCGDLITEVKTSITLLPKMVPVTDRGFGE